MPGARLDPTQMARRAAQEIRSGQAVAIGSGISATIPSIFGAGSGAWFLSESGVVGYLPDAAGTVVDSSGNPASVIRGGAVVGIAELAAMLAGGHVDLAFVEAAQVSSSGDFVHWTSSETPGLGSPGLSVDMASGAGRVVALLTHATDGGVSRIQQHCSLPVDGRRCVSLMVTDVAVLRVNGDGLELLEVAPGWTADDISSLTDAPLSVAPGLREMSFEVPTLEWPNKVCATAAEAIHDIPDGAAWHTT